MFHMLVSPHDQILKPGTLCDLMGIDKLKLVFQILVCSFLSFLTETSNEVCFHAKLQFLQKNNAVLLFSHCQNIQVSFHYLFTPGLERVIQLLVILMKQVMPNTDTNAGIFVT